MKVATFALGQWVTPERDLTDVRSAVSGEVVAQVSSAGIAMGEVLAFARNTGGPGLRALTFHQRAERLKALGQYLSERKDRLYQLSFETGATKNDAWFDVDGGIGTLFAYASRAKRELPNSTFLLDGPVEGLSKDGSFVGRHVLVSRQGVAVHINAFNFPCWGPLEKFAPAFLAGMPVVTKPATITSYVTAELVRLIHESGLLPAGALQMIVGPTRDLFDHLTGQDVVSFTGSSETAQLLQNHPSISRHSVRFIAERDSINASILGPDAGPGTPEFDLFVREVVREMTSKAGQKCTAIRRAFVPASHADAVRAALKDKLAATRVGHPALETTRMGALVGLGQREDVLKKIDAMRKEAELVTGDFEAFEVDGADKAKGAFLPPTLLYCSDPWAATQLHEIEAFGPVATLMVYRDVDDATALANRGGGSLAGSLFTHDADTARAVVFGASAYHGRLLIVDRDCAKTSTGHGSPLPALVHGGPGRAGGGEELGGMRGVQHYMQRTALQGSPAMLSAMTGSWIKGAPEVQAGRHPFRYPFEDLEIGQTFHSEKRTITLEDIEHFAHFTGDTFYAHMDEEATKGHPFFPGRVAHGYLLLSFAAGLFVDPDPGPVLANYGLDNLRFLKPIQPGEAIKVRLTAKQKSPRNRQYGEVRWDVEIQTDAGETAATYELLTMNALSGAESEG
jgi:oxepin-CoA hydrolase/3-oxo-5,6-dehydrosuberyl-CoA semialdehyde dehydrogenase